MRNWKNIGRRTLIGVVVAAAPLAAVTPAGAGHINKGEGHGGSGSTVTIQQITVNTSPDGCRFSIRFVADGIKSPKEHTVVADSTHLGVQDVLGASLTREQNGQVLLSGFSGGLVHGDDGDLVDVNVKLLDGRGKVVATDSGTATSSCT